MLRKLGENQSEQLPIDLPGRPLKRLGLAMEAGPIEAVQAGSPADEAGWKKGDILVSIDGEPFGDPETLNERLLKRAGQEVTIVTRRDGDQHEHKITLREPYAVEDPLTPAEPLVIGALGAAIEVTTHVASVVPGGPAEKAGVTPGAEVVSARLPSQTVKLDDKDVVLKEFVIEFGDGPQQASWPFFIEQLQNTLSDTTVELKLSDDHKVQVDVVLSEYWNADRGFNFEPLYVEVRAATMGEALRLGGNEAVESVAQVYRFLRKIGTQVSPKGMGGPLSIFGDRASIGQQGDLGSVDFPGHAQRQPGRAQLPADPALGRRAHGVPHPGRHPRQAGERARGDRLPLRRLPVHHQPDDVRLRARPGLDRAATVTAQR